MQRLLPCRAAAPPYLCSAAPALSPPWPRPGSCTQTNLRASVPGVHARASSSAAWPWLHAEPCRWTCMPPHRTRPYPALPATTPRPCLPPHHTLPNSTRPLRPPLPCRRLHDSGRNRGHHAQRRNPRQRRHLSKPSKPGLGGRNNTARSRGRPRRQPPTAVRSKPTGSSRPAPGSALGRSGHSAGEP